LNYKSTFYFRKKIPTLRILDTHVALLEEIRQQAMKDLGINIVFEPKGSAAVLQKAASRPGSFDLYEHIVIKIMVLSK
jgi:putative spermidine/putrescine transport system substrate-binding protein